MPMKKKKKKKTKAAKQVNAMGRTVNKVKVLVGHANGELEVREIDGDDFRELQKIVGGVFTRLLLGNGFALYCCDDGLLRKMPRNHAYDRAGRELPMHAPRMLVGDFFIAKERGSGLTSFAPREIELWSRTFGGGAS